MRAYIAAPFRSEACDMPQRAYGVVKESEYIEYLERLEGILLEAGYSTCLPHRDKGRWGRVYLEPEVVTQLCFDEISCADLVVALPGASRGVHLELGYAAGLGKRMILLVPDGQKVSTLLPGLERETGASLISFTSREDSLVALRNELGRVAQTPAISRSHRSAVVDVGSNTVKLLVVDSGHDGHLKPAKRASFSDAKLAQGFSEANDQLRQDAMERTAHAIEGAIEAAKREGASEIRVVSTGALRKAANAAEFLELVKTRSGHDIEVLTADDEARILYRGVVGDFRGERYYAVLNVGGTSTELIMGDSQGIQSVHHLGVGTLLLSDRHLHTNPPSDDEVSRLHDDVKACLREMSIPRLGPEDLLIHTGGELDYVLACGCPVTHLELGHAHPVAVKLSDFKEFSSSIAGMHREELHSLMPSNPTWLDGANACNAIAIQVAEALSARAIVPSNRNLADGIVSGVSGKIQA